MRDVAMNHVALNKIFGPFLQLPAPADLEGQQAVELALELEAEFGVAVEQLLRA